MPPASSGGIAIAGILNQLENINLDSFDSAIIATPINSHFEQAKFLIKWETKFKLQN